jgi:hypothetical protein
VELVPDELAKEAAGTAVETVDEVAARAEETEVEKASAMAVEKSVAAEG